MEETRVVCDFKASLACGITLHAVKEVGCHGMKVENTSPHIVVKRSTSVSILWWHFGCFLDPIRLASKYVCICVNLRVKKAQMRDLVVFPLLTAMKYLLNSTNKSVVKTSSTTATLVQQFIVDHWAKISQRGTLTSSYSECGGLHIVPGRGFCKRTTEPAHLNDYDSGTLV